MEKKNVVPDIGSYGSRLRGLVNGKKLSDSVELVEKLQQDGPKLDVICYNALIKGFCSDGKLGEAQKWHKELVKKGYVLNKCTFGLFVKLLCEKGKFDQALEMCVESINHGSSDFMLWSGIIVVSRALEYVRGDASLAFGFTVCYTFVSFGFPMMKEDFALVAKRSIGAEVILGKRQLKWRKEQGLNYWRSRSESKTLESKKLMLISMKDILS
ncbi:Pentatricopeptide repeat [Dillenia turbinata]|uniref:Pentatricopeptide repeat n=1 Tax=Dillenia turbinata TaxID=194707 RepID=A0AAN8VSA1_9MAGN